MGTLALDPRTRQRTHRETVAAGSVSGPVLLARELLPATVAVHPAPGATARVEYTLAPQGEVEAGSGAVRWLPWPPGDVAAATFDTITGPVSALRCVASGGDVDWEVLA